MGVTPRDHYEILGVSPDASAQEITSAFRTLALRYHPDVNHGWDAGQHFREISDAYEVLHDPGRRAQYDAVRARHSDDRRPRAARASPVFAAGARARDVPRFLDDPPAGRYGPAEGVAQPWNLGHAAAGPYDVFRALVLDAFEAFGRDAWDYYSPRDG
jgi:curved DNA-binding protein CbpA